MEGSSGGEPVGIAGEDPLLATAVDRIAHQLRNPLQAIAVNLEVIRLRARREDTGEVDRVAGVVDDNVRLLDRRLGYLIDLARRSPDEPVTSVDAAGLVAGAAAAFRLDAREDGMLIRVEVPGEGRTGTAGGEAGASAEGDAAEAALTVEARRGSLLALVLRLALRLSREAAGGVLRVRGEGDRVWLEAVPEEAGGGWARGAAREEMEQLARLAGGEAAPTGEGGADAAGEFRVSFPRG